MNAKLLITAALILALVAIPVQPARSMRALPPSANPNIGLVECIVVMVVIVVGGTIIYGLYKMCKRLDRLNPGTNNIAGNNLVPRGLGDADTFTIQSSESPVGGFSEVVRFTVSQAGAALTAIAYTNGIPVATNSAAIGVTNGVGYATVDFTGLALEGKTPQCRFFRVTQ